MVEAVVDGLDLATVLRGAQPSGKGDRIGCVGRVDDVVIGDADRPEYFPSLGAHADELRGVTEDELLGPAPQSALGGRRCAIAIGPDHEWDPRAPAVVGREQCAGPELGADDDVGAVGGAGRGRVTTGRGWLSGARSGLARWRRAVGEALDLECR